VGTPSTPQVAPVPPAVGPGILPSATQPQVPAPTTTPGISPVPAAPPRDPAQPPQAGGGATPSGAQQAAQAAAQVSVTTPGPEFRVGGGPYTVPIAINGASRLSLVSLTVTFNPSAVRVRTVQEGPFLRQGGASVTFTQQVDASAGRVDISMTRSADQTGASGTGLLAALVMDAVAAGTATFSVSGVATTPDGRTVPLTFVPATVTVK
jgi:general secretion pathway protein D